MFAETYAKFYDSFNSDKDYKNEIHFVSRWANHPKSILDICCGTASYWKYFHPKTVISGIEQSCPMIRYSNYRDKILQANIMSCKMICSLNFDAAICLFDAINYIPDHSWWNNLPIKQGGYFIFDIWDKDKVDKEGFRSTLVVRPHMERYIRPVSYNGKKAELKIYLTGYDEGKDICETEIHKLYIWSEKDIRKFAKESFKIVEVKKTKRWQTWYKLKRK